MPSSDSRLPTPSPSVIFKPLDEGGVLLSTTDEVYFGVNGVGANIWSLLPPATTTFEELCQRLASQFSDVAIEQIRTDVRKFILELVDSGLAVWPEGTQQSGASESAGQASNPV